MGGGSGTGSQHLLSSGEDALSTVMGKLMSMEQLISSNWVVDDRTAFIRFAACLTMEWSYCSRDTHRVSAMQLTAEHRPTRRIGTHIRVYAQSLFVSPSRANFETLQPRTMREEILRYSSSNRRRRINFSAKRSRADLLRRSASPFNFNNYSSTLAHFTC